MNWEDELIEKWHKYCHDGKSYDECEFQFLLYPEKKLQRSQLLDIFRYYDCKEELTNRILFLYDFLNEENRVVLSPDDIETLAKEDLLAKMSIYEICLDEKPAYIAKKDVLDCKVRFVKNENKFLSLVRDPDNVRGLLDEDIREGVLCNLDQKKIIALYGLREALYGFRADYSLIDYVLSAFVPESINFSKYIALRQSGANYAMIGSELFITFDPWRKLL